MKTIAQQLGVTEFPFYIRNRNGDVIYHEKDTGYWVKYEYDSNGDEIYYEDCTGAWTKREYDSKGRIIYYEDSDGIIDSRPKEDVIILNGIKYKRIEEL